MRPAAADLIAQHMANCPAAKATPGIQKAITELSAQLKNGLTAKVNLIWKLQWWQISILVALIGAILTAGVLVVSEVLHVNQQLVKELNEAILTVKAAK